VTIPSPGEVLAAIFGPGSQAGDAEVTFGPCDSGPASLTIGPCADACAEISC